MRARFASKPITLHTGLSAKSALEKMLRAKFRLDGGTRYKYKYSLCPILFTPLDPSIRKNSGILSKRHVILVELNETCSCMYNIKCGRKSLNVHNRVCLQKNCGTSIVK